jgi:hypothetical protein
VAWTCGASPKRTRACRYPDVRSWSSRTSGARRGPRRRGHQLRGRDRVHPGRARVRARATRRSNASAAAASGSTPSPPVVGTLLRQLGQELIGRVLIPGEQPRLAQLAVANMSPQHISGLKGLPLAPARATNSETACSSLATTSWSSVRKVPPVSSASKARRTSSSFGWVMARPSRSIAGGSLRRASCGRLFAACRLRRAAVCPSGPEAPDGCDFRRFQQGTRQTWGGRRGKQDGRPPASPGVR